MNKFDIWIFKLVQWVHFHNFCKIIFCVFIDIERVFISTCIASKGSALFVFVIITCLKCRTRTNQRILIFLFCNFKWTIVLISVGKSNKPSFLLNKFIKMSMFTFSLITTKCLHSQVKGIHCSRHGTDEFWLIFIYKTIDFVCILLDFFSFLNHFGVRFFLIVTLFTTSCSIVFSELSNVCIFFPIIDSLFVMETLYIISVRDSLTQRFWIVGSIISLGFRCLF